MSVSANHHPISRTALITGGSSGIGYAIAGELARRGYQLILTSNEEAKLLEICHELTNRFEIKTWPLFLDLSESGAATKLFQWCQMEKLQVDVLVNNAGVFFFGEVAETDPEKAERMISLHMATPALLCTLFAKEMKKRRNGHILNISSLAAFMPYPGIALYSATKRFLKSFSRALRTEMIDYNVNVTCICPGAVSTNLYKLSESDHQKAIRTGIMMRPDKLARYAVDVMLRRKSLVIPGFLNRIFLLLIYFLPHGLILLIRRHSRFLPPENTDK